MSRLMIAGAAALATALTAVPGMAQGGRYADSSLEPSITVTAPRMRTEGRSSSGAPIRRIETDSIAYIGDLDLRRAADRRELDARVQAAAGEACDFLDQHYGSPSDSSSTARECRSDAVKSAQLQVRDAIERSAMAEYSAYDRGY